MIIIPYTHNSFVILLTACRLHEINFTKFEKNKEPFKVPDHEFD